MRHVSKRAKRGHVSLATLSGSTTSDTEPLSGNASDGDRECLEHRRFAGDHTADDLRSICLMVAHEAKEESRRFREIAEHGWPQKATREDEQEEDEEVRPREGDQPAGRGEGPSTSDHGGAVVLWEPHFRLRVRPKPVGRNAQDTNEDGEVTGGVGPGDGTCEVAAASADPLGSAELAEVIDALEVFAATRRGTGRYAADSRKLKLDIERIAKDVLPRLLLKLYANMDSFPTAANARRRPYEYGNFAKRMGDRYEGALCEIGKEVGIGRETVAKALEKFASKLEKDWGP